MSENKPKKNQQSESAPQLSHRDALTADFGSDATKRAKELGYDGYVWEESKAQYTVSEVTNNDQSGPNRTVEEDFDPMESHFIRADKLDEGKK
jgi:hypothetical protein